MPVKKVIRFNDIDGNPVEQEYYFTLGKSDVVDMDFAHSGDPKAYLQEIIDKKDSRQFLKLWRELLFRSVGKRDGNLLVKNETVLQEFKYSGAYEELFSELLQNDDGGTEFFMSIMPADVQEKIAEESAREYTKDQLLSMSQADFDRIVGTDEATMSREHLLIAFQRKNLAEPQSA